METLGNILLLDRHRIGFLAGSKIAALSVFPIFDWTAEIASHHDVSIVSGFHSQLERQVLDFILRGDCGIICVLARSLYANVPLEFIPAYNEGRVLFVSAEKHSRSTKESSHRRNQFVINLADELITPKISCDSSLYNLNFQNKPHNIL